MFTFILENSGSAIVGVVVTFLITQFTSRIFPNVQHMEIMNRLEFVSRKLTLVRERTVDDVIKGYLEVQYALLRYDMAQNSIRTLSIFLLLPAVFTVNGIYYMTIEKMFIFGLKQFLISLTIFFFIAYKIRQCWKEMNIAQHEADQKRDSLYEKYNV